MHPVTAVLIAAGLSCAISWITSLVTKETSWVDRLWSIVPVIYVWIFAIDAIASGRDSTRLIVMAALVTVWGARLTFNFARKGGYSGMEDYRWAILRERMSPALFQVFNLLFIVLYQNALLVLITMPALIAWENATPFGAWDVVFASLFVIFLLGETIADQQQWIFHRKKARGAASGFLTGGLFRFSRHPNFFFEQAQWWAFYAIGAVAASGLGFVGGILNWTIAGAVLLTLLFIGSTIFTESISQSKYPAYADYRRTTSMLIPLPPRRPSTAEATA